jgi:hypothetical protein
VISIYKKRVKKKKTAIEPSAIEPSGSIAIEPGYSLNSNWGFAQP